MTNLKKICCSAILFLGFISFAGASVFQTDYKFESIYIYSFTKYLEWPEGTVKDQFVIGAYSYSPIMQDLMTATTGKKSGNATIVVRVVNSTDELESCQMLFIPSEKENELMQLSKIAASKHILLITEGKNTLQKGAAINLVHVDGKLKFEINESVIKKSGLKVSSQLLSLAILVM
ncbi:MAG: YfiR family protein [Bacteroidetes bacterium]|nr:YfiR family protein [Bacteroidota bacterium]